VCHHVLVSLSAEEKRDARKLSAVLIPVYASIVLAVIALVAVTSAPQQGELVASRSAPAAMH
jgi:hypothetical protein